MASSIIIILSISSWNLEISFKKYSELQTSILGVTLIPFIGTFISAYLCNSLLLKYTNHSNIEAFKRNIIIPEELKDIV